VRAGKPLERMRSSWMELAAGKRPEWWLDDVPWLAALGASARVSRGGWDRAWGMEAMARMLCRSDSTVNMSAPPTVCLHGTGGCASCRDGKTTS
jgi:hypothetical protein